MIIRLTGRARNVVVTKKVHTQPNNGRMIFDERRHQSRDSWERRVSRHFARTLFAAIDVPLIYYYYYYYAIGLTRLIELGIIIERQRSQNKEFVFPPVHSIVFSRSMTTIIITVYDLCVTVLPTVGTHMAQYVLSKNKIISTTTRVQNYPSSYIMFYIKCWNSRFWKLNETACDHREK